LVDSNIHESLNFTHRASHGVLGHGDKHGKLSDVARDFLAKLKSKHGKIFEEPVYPIVRRDATLDYQHYIHLKDKNLDPPKRRLYPLDEIEL
jgi:hypothetical protein